MTFKELSNKKQKEAFDLASKEALKIMQIILTDYGIFNTEDYINLSDNKNEWSLGEVTGKESILPRDIDITNDSDYKNLSNFNIAEDAVVTGRVSELSQKQYLAQRFPGSSPGHGASALLILNKQEAII